MANQPRGLYRPTYIDRNGNKKQSKVWCMDYFCRGCSEHPNGGRHQESTGKKLQREAQAELDKKRGVAAEGKPILNVNEIRMSTLFTEMLNWTRAHKKLSTYNAYADTVHLHLDPALGMYRAVDVCLNSSILTNFVAKKKTELQKKGINKDKPLADSTINGMLILVGRALSLARNRIQMIPLIEKLETGDNSRKTHFSEIEYKSFLRDLPDDVRRPIQVLWLTGWRSWSEVFNRERRHLDLKAGKLILEPGEAKNSEPRIFPLIPGSELLMIFQEQEAATKEFEKREGRLIRWLFHHDGEPLANYYEKRDKWCPTRYFLKAWKDACKAAGLVGKIRHDFRRSATRNFDEYPDHIGMKLTGHKTARIYQQYKAIGDKDLFKAVAEVEARKRSAR